MRGKFGFEQLLGVTVAFVCTCIGLTSMIGLSPSVRALKAEIAQALASGQEEEAALSVPVSGMNVTLSEYVASNEENAISFLSTTVLLSSDDENEYINDDGTCIGRYIVCTSSNGASVYEAAVADTEEAQEIAHIETYGVAAVVSLDGQWCEIVSGDVYGYVKAENFAFGEDAACLDEYTYKYVVTINEDDTYMYQLANSDSTVLCVLQSGMQFEVVSEGTNYIRIDVDGVGKGLVKTDCVTAQNVRITAVSTESAQETAEKIAEGVSQAEALDPSFIWPLPYPYYSNYITSYYGSRSTYVGSSYHRGIDIHAAKGTSIYAVMDGTVVKSDYNGSAGYEIIIDHGNGLYTLYYHMASKSEYSEGDEVSQGDVIGYVGSSGTSTGYHLHFAVGVGSYHNEDLVNPLDYLN